MLTGALAAAGSKRRRACLHSHVGHLFAVNLSSSFLSVTLVLWFRSITDSCLVELFWFFGRGNEGSIRTVQFLVVECSGR